MTVKRIKRPGQKENHPQLAEFYPRIRTEIEPFPIKDNGSIYVVLQDSLGLSADSLVLPYDLFYTLKFFDGRHSGTDIRVEYLQKFGQFLFEDRLVELLRRLDQHFLLHNERAQARLQELKHDYRRIAIREPYCVGQSYPDDAGQLAKKLDEYANAVRNHQHLVPVIKNRPIKAFIAPHIDPRLGGSVYAQVYQLVAQSAPADLYVIFGIAHQGAANYFALTKKDFVTPLGQVKTDAGLVDEVGNHSETDFMYDELQHRAEHSIEFQTIFLKHFVKTDFKILPILCSFPHTIFSRQGETGLNKFAAFIEALKKSLQSYPGRVCFVASVDLAHVGPRYGDRQSPTPAFFAQMERNDGQVLRALMKQDQAKLQETISANDNRYNICGYPALTALMAVMPKAHGELLDYSSAEMDESKSTVSFASMIFY